MKKVILGSLAAILLAGTMSFASGCNCCSQENCPATCKDSCKQGSCEMKK